VYGRTIELAGGTSHWIDAEGGERLLPPASIGGLSAVLAAGEARHGRMLHER
jgi:hypothetical protein